MTEVIENQLLKMEDEEYFSIPRTSSSAVRTFARDRRLFQLEYIEKVLPEKDSPALRIGSAVHAWALEGEDAYRERFSIGPPVDARTTQWKEFVEASPEGKVILTGKEANQVKYMVKRLWDNQLFQELMEDISPQVEHAIFFNFEGFECKSKLDVIGHRPDGRMVLVDLKTTQDVEPSKFQESCRHWGYVSQVAFYCRAAMACGMPHMDEWEVYIAAVDKKFPTAACVFKIEPEDLWLGDLDNKHNLRELRSCYDSGNWCNPHERTIQRIRY